MLYTTQYVLNLATGEPFSFEVPAETLQRLEKQKRLIAANKAPALGTIERLTQLYEFSFFPTYSKVLKIWTENGYSDELMREILEDFGLKEPFVSRILENEDFLSGIRPWFEDITQDGERASRTLAIIYQEIKKCFSL